MLTSIRTAWVALGVVGIAVGTCSGAGLNYPTTRKSTGWSVGAYELP